MDNLNEQKSEEMTSQSNMPKTIQISNKLKWILGIIGFILILSIVINFLFYFTNKYVELTKQQKTDINKELTEDEVILGELYEIDKKVENNDNIWLSIKTTDRNSFNLSQNYDFWYINNNKRRLVDSFPIIACGGVDWEINNKGGVDLNYNVSPCEAFIINTKIIYNNEGMEQFMVRHNSSADNFTFQQKNNLEYEVSLITEGICEGSNATLTSVELIPKVLFKGIKIKSYLDEKDFLLDNFEEISCVIGYGESINNPVIKDIIFDEEKIEFTLSSNHKAEISLKDDTYAEVEFK